jgi:hypothetical protein
MPNFNWAALIKISAHLSYLAAVRFKFKGIIFNRLTKVS